MAMPRLTKASGGSGFRVSADGYILTNAHLVEGCTEVRVPPAGPVVVVARDDASDLALLKGRRGGPLPCFGRGGASGRARAW